MGRQQRWGESNRFPLPPIEIKRDTGVDRGGERITVKAAEAASELCFSLARGWRAKGPPSPRPAAWPVGWPGTIGLAWVARRQQRGGQAANESCPRSLAGRSSQSPEPARHGHGGGAAGAPRRPHHHPVLTAQRLSPQLPMPPGTYGPMALHRPC
jgi:hypothetical protein